eukprot:TRINITY_DN2814_c0_g1_i1.p1 TRINITY_DN2814_c0_g1~~TRINITY_DN2814_c0_g1_i1.p1  ORF type:complete len:204 (+),score=72.62 TRINITY_DN2814_c0_g1_i1:175-786(+)
MSKPKKKRGLSLEDKREKVLGMFHSTLDVLNIKEVEKGATARGVIAQSVKDVLKSLVDDDMVENDKIGIGSFFWSFPSKALCELRAKQAVVDQGLATERAKTEELQRQLGNAQAGKEETDERAAKKRRLEYLTKTSEDADVQLAQYEGNSAEFMQQLQAGIEEARAAANRWTDNLDCGRKWLKKKYGVEKNVLDNLFPELEPV